MDEEPGRLNPDEYPLAPPEPRSVDQRPLSYGVYHEPSFEEPQQDRRRWQFSLSEMLWITAGTAVVLSLLGCLPGGYSAKGFAAVAGMAVLVSLVFLEMLKPQRMIFYIGWWLGFGAYVLSSAAAITLGK